MLLIKARLKCTGRHQANVCKVLTLSMPKQSAGILAYRISNNITEVLLVHPGGPFFAKKDIGAWSIPKGEFEPGEEPLDAARREFKEETGMPIDGVFIPLTPVKLKSGKTVHAWAIERDIDLTNFVSNTFQLEWPIKSGRFIEIPEVDKAEWMDIATARQKINAGQVPLLDELLVMIGK